MVDMLDDALDLELEVGRLALQVLPTRDHHDGVERHAQDAAALDHRLDLVVRELPVPGSERAAILVAGPERPIVNVERVPEALIAQMRDIEDDAELLHLLEKV